MSSRIGGLPGVGRVAQALGVNSVPALGILGGGWSAGTALALYWLESVLVIVVVAARIVLHRRWTRKAGHWSGRLTIQRQGRPAETRRTTLLRSYLGVAIPFTLAHGLFLSALLFLVFRDRPEGDFRVSLPDLRAGLLGVSVLIAVGFVLDLVGLRDRPFRWIERGTERALGRVFVVHLTIVLGMFATVWTDGPAGLFMVFVGLKTLFDLGSILPERELALDPPRWLRGLDRVKGKDGETFSEHWRRTEEAARRQRESNEQPLTALPAD
jgi:hypothetical protein